MKYENIVPWGRSFEEYVDFFLLSEEDLNKKILGCSDGPASFNSVMNKKGNKIQSIDPIYQYISTVREMIIRPQFVKEIKKELLNYKKFKELTDEWIGLSIELSKLKIELQKKNIM